MRKRVTVESPYAGDVERNVAYLKRCLLDSVSRGEAPLASHLLYTQFLDDLVPDERAAGIDCGLTWAVQAEAMAFYLDYGTSVGMEKAWNFAIDHGIHVDTRRIGLNPGGTSREEGEA